MRVIGTILGVALILLGLPLFASPIPLGIVVVPLGLVVLVASSPWARRRIRAARERHERLDRFVGKAEAKLPGRAARTLERTDPDADVANGGRKPEASRHDDHG